MMPSLRRMNDVDIKKVKLMICLAVSALRTNGNNHEELSISHAYTCSHGALEILP